MEEIIVIAVIAAAFVFRIVSKKLNSAAKNSEVFPPIQVDPNLEKASKTEVKTVPEPVVARMPETKVVDEVVSEVIPEIEEAPRMLEENPSALGPLDDKSEQKEKIDPKKLVIYSEIMKPKYVDRN